MTARRRPRQADIARAAGVSQATVSLVLGGKPDVVGLAAGTVQRVHEAARELGYVADPAAVRLARRRNYLLGVHTFSATFPVDIENSYYPFLAGVEQRAADRGYDIVLFTGTSGDGGERPARTDAVSRLRLTDGCVLFGRRVPVPELERLLDDGFPIVYIGRREELGERLAHVGADYVSASRRVVEHLAELGHERIVYLREQDENLASGDREHGVRAALRALGLPEQVIRTDGAELDADWVRERTAEGVTAFVTEGSDTNRVARLTSNAIRDAGLDCPADVSIAMLGEYVVPPPGAPVITGFSVPRREMGRAAVDLLLELIDGVDVPAERRRSILDCEFVAGQTAGPPPSARRRTGKRGARA